ncbi:MAG: ABC transporter ATP-binding protein [Chlamydiales bacterium]|nr:ABC transporter ATP-binding protein [Chlamydiales bacterium]
MCGILAHLAFKQKNKIAFKQKNKIAFKQKNKNGYVLWEMFFAGGKKNFLLLLGVILTNFLSAFLEGISFALMLIALAVLGGSPLNLKIYPFLSNSFFEQFIQSMSSQGLFTLFIVLAVVMQALRSGFAAWGQVYTTFLSTSIESEAQHRIYHQILRLSFPCISTYKVGDLVEYANTPSRIVSVMSSFNQFLVSLLTIIALVFVMSMISLSLTIVVLTLFIILGVVQKRIVKKITVASRKLTEHLVEFSKHTIQSLNGIRTIFTFNRQRNVEDKIHNTILEMVGANRKLNLLNSSIMPLNELIGISLVGTCLIIGPFLLDGEPSFVLPLLLTFITVTYRLASRMQALMVGFGAIAFQMGGILRLQEILSDDDKEFAPIQGDPFPGLFQMIEFRHISLNYSKHHEFAVRDLTFSVPKGSVLALVGSSGAGKSSIVDLLLRLYEPTSGEIFIDGRDLTQYSIGSWRDALGVVSQDTFIFNESIEENICFGCQDVSEEQIVNAAKMAGAHEFISRLSSGYHTVVGERGYRLSGGERQRIALARAFLRRPEVLVLDEATSNLDSHSESLIQEAVEKSREDRTIIVVAHRLSTIVKADQILVLDKGFIVEQGTHMSLLQKNGKYAYLWKMQSHPSDNRH